MEKNRADFDRAVEVSLEAHAGHKRYLEATESLYAVFVEGWGGSRRGLPEAFDSFRQALLAESCFKSDIAPESAKSKPAA